MKSADKAKSGLGIFFSGEYVHSLDPQRRIAIPRTWRSRAGASRFFLLPGRNKTLQLIPFETLQEFLDKARKVSFADASASLALARLGAMAQECECDGQGRISIPPKLMEHAELKSEAEVVLVGAVNNGWILSKASWNRMQAPVEDVLDVVQKITEKPDDLVDILKGRI